MNKNVEQLIESLDKASEIYSELTQLASEKREFIKNQQIEELEKVINHEMGLVAALYKLEDLRAKIVDKLIRENGYHDVKNLTDLSKYLSPSDRRAVTESKTKLLLGIKTVSDETKFNNRMLEDKIALLDLSIQMLAGVEDEEDGYGNVKGRKNIFDARI